MTYALKILCFQIVETMTCVSACAAVIDDQRLLLFCVPLNKQISPIPQCIMSTDTFMTDLNHILPSHGVPDEAFWVKELPLTLHGKLNRKGLIQLAEEVEKIGDSIVDCRGVSEKLQEMWKV